MMNLIELLYFRDMVPKAQDSQEVKKILRKLSDNEEFLTQRLEGEERSGAICKPWMTGTKPWVLSAWIAL